MNLKDNSGASINELFASAVAIILFPILWIIFYKQVGWSFWISGLVALVGAYVSVAPVLLIWAAAAGRLWKRE